MSFRALAILAQDKTGIILVTLNIVWLKKKKSQQCGFSNPPKARQQWPDQFLLLHQFKTLLSFFCPFPIFSFWVSRSFINSYWKQLQCWNFLFRQECDTFYCTTAGSASTDVGQVGDFSPKSFHACPNELVASGSVLPHCCRHCDSKAQKISRTCALPLCGIPLVFPS